jgi:hypothetical protein
MKKAPKEPALDAFDARFARAQTEWALWVNITSERKSKPTSIFRARIKQLLEFDRSEPTRRGVPYSGMAFSDQRSEGSGDHSFFSVYDALFLRLGLGLLDCGFKRKEVVLLLRDLRGPLRKQIGKVINDRAAAFSASVPLFRDYDPLEANRRVVLVLPRVEAAADYIDEGDARVHICTGMERLKDAVEEHLLEKLVLLDVGLAAYTLPSLLLNAPASQRLRKPKA